MSNLAVYRKSDHWDFATCDKTSSSFFILYIRCWVIIGADHLLTRRSSVLGKWAVVLVARTRVQLRYVLRAVMWYSRFGSLFPFLFRFSLWRPTVPFYFWLYTKRPLLKKYIHQVLTVKCQMSFSFIHDSFMSFVCLIFDLSHHGFRLVTQASLLTRTSIFNFWKLFVQFS